MSQRLIYVLLVFAVFVIVGALAFATGHPLVLSGDTLNEKLISVIAPFTLVLTVVHGFLAVIDARVISGLLAPGDVFGLLGMSEFWVTTVSVIAGVMQMFSFEAISPDTQAAIVNAGLLLATILLWSLADRAPEKRETTEALSVRRGNAISSK